MQAIHSLTHSLIHSTAQLPTDTFNLLQLQSAPILQFNFKSPHSITPVPFSALPASPLLSSTLLSSPPYHEYTPIPCTSTNSTVHPIFILLQLPSPHNILAPRLHRALRLCIDHHLKPRPLNVGRQPFTCKHHTPLVHGPGLATGQSLWRLCTTYVCTKSSPGPRQDGILFLGSCLDDYATPGLHLDGYSFQLIALHQHTSSSHLLTDTSSWSAYLQTLSQSFLLLIDISSLFTSVQTLVVSIS
jgi:hypothetical protein